MNDLFLIARIDGQRVALAANTVESVVNVTATTSVPLAPPHVIGLAALRSRVITMIDSRAALNLAAVDADGPLITIVVNIDGHQYGLVVDRVEDVCAISGELAPLRGRIGGGWAGAALGLLDHGGATLLLLDPARLAAGPLKAAA